MRKRLLKKQLLNNLHKKKMLKTYYENELQMNERNWDRCQQEWDQIKEQYECDKMKMDITEINECLVQINISRNNQIAEYMKALDDIVEQTDLLVAVKISAFDKLMDMYKSRYYFFNNRYSGGVADVKECSTTTENEITDFFVKAKEELNFLLSYQANHDHEALNNLKNRKVEAIFEKDSENKPVMEKLEQELQGHMEWIMIKLQTTLMTYFYLNHYKLMEYDKIKDVDKRYHTIIVGNFDRISNSKIKINILRMKLKELNDEIIRDLKEKKAKLLKTFVEHQRIHHLTMKSDKLRLKLLSHEAAKTLKLFQNGYEKAGRVLDLKKLCIALTIPTDRIIEIDQDSNISVRDKLQVFWNNVGKVESYLPELRMEVTKLMADNIMLKHSLKDLVAIYSK